MAKGVTLGGWQGCLYVGQLELATVLIEGWIIYSDVHDLLDGPCDVACLPTHSGEVVHPSVMTCCIGTVTDGGKKKI